MIKRSRLPVRFGVVLALSMQCSIVVAEDPAHAERQGSLLIGGGGALSDEIYDRFVALAGGNSGRLVVIPTATTDDNWLTKPKALAAYIEDWRGRGIPSVTVLHTRDRSRANQPHFAEPLTIATAVWLGGGDQALLEQTYVGTLVETEICGLLARGGIVGGSEPGAAIQSRVMIRDGDDVPEIGTGFDLVPNAIVDQHFLQRNRVNRLFEAVRRHPDCVGIGIDERAAILVQGCKFEVLGESYVVLVRMGPGGEKAHIRVHKKGETAQLKEVSPRPHSMQ